MSVDDVRSSISSPSIPHPRTTGSAAAVEPQTETAAEPQARYPWPEPWRAVAGARPRTEYWDVTTASWREGRPLPPARPAD